MHLKDFDCSTKDAFLALSLPPFCDEGTGRETGLWDVVDDCVDEFLRNRIHGKVTVVEKDARVDTIGRMG